MKDTIFANPMTTAPFTFDQQVASVFPDMIQRSVPGYCEILHYIAQWAHKLAQPHSIIYDLGCSLGAVTSAIRQRISGMDCQIIAVDQSQAMVERAEQYIFSFKSAIPVSVVCEDILQTQIKNASLVVLNFTLQFLSPSDRQRLINNIYNGLNARGALILSEKIRFDAPICHQLIDDIHIDFKRANGYSELEISQKRQSLENVMKTDTLNIHFNRLEKAGFNQMSTWYQQLNFASMIAIK